LWVRERVGQCNQLHCKSEAGTGIDRNQLGAQLMPQLEIVAPRRKWWMTAALQLCGGADIGHDVTVDRSCRRLDRKGLDRNLDRNRLDKSLDMLGTGEV
jgi:hypothetical protein